MILNRSIVALLTVPMAALLLASCGHEGGDDHDHSHHTAQGEAPAQDEHSLPNAEFKAGRGVMLTDETRQILGVQVTQVVQQPMPQQVRFNVQLFGEKHHPLNPNDDHAGCDVQGSGFVPLEQAAALRAGHPVQIGSPTNESFLGVVLAVQKSFSMEESEVIVGLTNATGKLRPGDFLPASITLPRAGAVTTIPRSALLRTADGLFVYVVREEAFSRTPVKVGAEAGGLFEITDGLVPGDAVVTKPVETLYLVELRATKGGGHSH